MILAHFGCDSEIGAEKCRPEFCHQFLEGVCAITEALAELTGDALLVAGPVHQLVRLGGRVALGIAEGLYRR